MHTTLVYIAFTDGNDYTEETGPRTNNFLFFNNAIRRSCFNVEIEDDDCYEFEEQFSLQFVALEGTSIPDNLAQFPNVSTLTILDNEGTVDSAKTKLRPHFIVNCSLVPMQAD